jgi:hypothetical protein
VHRNEDAYQGEHWLSWLFAIGAIVLGVIGALEAWDKIDLGQSFVMVTTTAGVTTDLDANNFRDGMLFMVPSLIAGVLAWTWHRSEHHVRHHSHVAHNDTHRHTADMEREEGLAMGEHIGSYIAALGAIAMAVTGILVGFNVLEETHTFYDGMVWLVLSLMASILAATLHSVGHHQEAFEEDEIRRIVDVHIGAQSVTGLEGRRTRTVDIGR